MDLKRQVQLNEVTWICVNQSLVYVIYIDDFFLTNTVHRGQYTQPIGCPTGRKQKKPLIAKFNLKKGL